LDDFLQNGRGNVVDFELLLHNSDLKFFFFEGFFREVSTVFAIYWHMTELLDIKLFWDGVAQ
jgi:hypothetical protein